MTDVVFDLFTERSGVGRERYVFPPNSRLGYIAEPRFPLQKVALTTGIKVTAHDLRRILCHCGGKRRYQPARAQGAGQSFAAKGVTEGYVQMSVNRLREPAQKVADKLKQLCRTDGRGR
jgi:hypothetical protein